MSTTRSQHVRLAWGGMSLYCRVIGGCLWKENLSSRRRLAAQGFWERKDAPTIMAFITLVWDCTFLPSPYRLLLATNANPGAEPALLSPKSMISPQVVYPLPLEVLAQAEQAEHKRPPRHRGGTPELLPLLHDQDVVRGTAWRALVPVLKDSFGRSGEQVR